MEAMNRWVFHFAPVLTLPLLLLPRVLRDCRIRPNHDPLLDWVYNGADIDRQKVVWARDMGAEKNEELLCYYKDRRWWLLDADASPPRLVPYPGEATIKATGPPSNFFGPPPQHFSSYPP